MRAIHFNNLGLKPLFDNILDDLLTEVNSGFTSPSFNIKETEEAYTIDMAAAGYQKSDFNIEVADKKLTISVDKTEDVKQDGEAYKVRQFKNASFKKSFNLSNKINGSDIKATYENGILNITLPKTKLQEPEKTVIEVL